MVRQVPGKVQHWGFWKVLNLFSCNITFNLGRENLPPFAPVFCVPPSPWWCSGNFPAWHKLLTVILAYLERLSCFNSLAQLILEPQVGTSRRSVKVCEFELLVSKLYLTAEDESKLRFVYVIPHQSWKILHWFLLRFIKCNTAFKTEDTFWIWNFVIEVVLFWAVVLSKLMAAVSREPGNSSVHKIIYVYH